MYDDLRQAAQSRDDVEVRFEDARVQEERLFGMTAIERMFLSVGLFGVTLVISLALLLLTESIGF